MSAEDIKFLTQVVLLGLLSMAVDLAGIAVLAWNHAGQQLLPMASALFLVLGTTVVLAYRLGKAQP